HFFQFFWLYLHYLPYLEICTDHVNTTPNMSTITIFALLTIFGNVHRPCKHYPNSVNNDHANSTPTLSTTVYIMSIIFVSFFPDFLAIFALLIIFGIAHRPCKQYPNHITTPSLFFF
ncbi:hypothetical protein K443DRAFT_91769, partial [Laccaria amethystina LaAM-08-1]